MPSTKFKILNDKVSQETPTVSPSQNRAFRYGDGLFETILVRNGKAWRKNAHLKRLISGMAVLGMKFEAPKWKSLLTQRVEALAQTCVQTGFGRIRLQVFRTDGGAYLPSSDAPELFSEVTPLDDDPWIFSHGARIGVYHAVPVVDSILSSVKSLNALPYVMAARYARSEGWDDALLRSTNGDIAESSRANIFLVRNATVFTPPLTSGCLPGIMRDTVLTASRALGLETLELPATISSLEAADEIFLTNVIRGLVPVHQIANCAWQSAQGNIRQQLESYIRQTQF